MINPIYRATDGLLANEFVSGRSAIHFHCILFVERQLLKLIETVNNMEDGNAIKIPNITYEDDTYVSSTSEISLYFLNMSIALHNLMIKLDHYITKYY